MSGAERPTNDADKRSSGEEISLDPSSGNVFKHDGPAGTVVFLVALPLCLGIALASGAPLFSGITAGIIGGIVISVLSGSNTSVSGPAAGLAVIVAQAIQDLGSYNVFLCAVVVAGAIQLAMGVVRLGVIGDYCPNAVIKGMLAAIGLVITLKQIPHALGYDRDFIGDLAFKEDGGNTLSDLVVSLTQVNPGSLLIAVCGLAVLLTWDRLPKGMTLTRLLRIVPAPLIVVVLGISLNQLLRISLPALYIDDPEHLVRLPVAGSVAEFFALFTTPDFSAAARPDVWRVAVTLAIVASIETLLSLEAADRIDPYKRISPPSRELVAQGVGNMLSGLIGGLPVTSVVVRSSANVYAGARTWLSSFIHGSLLLGATMLFPSLLNLTPLASLAAILIVIGMKLSRPSLYREMYRAGLDQFIPFLVTVLAVVFTDLLTGVLIGLACGFLFVIRTNHHEAITVVRQDNCYLMRFNKDASFVNKSELRSKLRSIPTDSHLVIDGTRALYIDRDIYEVVRDFLQLAPYRRTTVRLKHFEANSASKRAKRAG